MLVYNNRGINIKIDDASDMWLFNGSLLKIFFEQIYPPYIAYFTRYYLKPKEISGSYSFLFHCQPLHFHLYLIMSIQHLLLPCKIIIAYIKLSCLSYQ